MPIRPPALDDRSFEDLVADLVRRIPAHTPEWTDPRIGDPGRTLIDLFAWLGDTILYRANLIPERQRLSFLRLLGQGMRPAQPATGLVQVLNEDPAYASATLPPRHALKGPTPFETLEEMTALPVEGKCYIKRRTNAAEAAQFASLLPDLQELYGLATRPTAYVTTPVFIDGAAEPQGRDLAAEAIDSTLWIALLAREPGEAEVLQAREALAGGASGERAALSVGVAPAFDMPAPLAPVGPRAPIPHRWEICGPDPAGTTFMPLEVLADRSAGLTLPGTLRLLLPGGDDFGAPKNDVLEKLDAGVGNVPPRIDDPQVAARIVTWIRLRPARKVQPGTLKFAWAGINAVRIEARKSLGRQHVGKGTGMSGQEVSLGLTSVEPASLQIEVEEEEGMVPWRQVPDVHMGGRNERIYALDPEAGTIRFGDGMHGLAPAIGKAIHVAYARTGGGAAGNLPPGTLKAVDPPPGGGLPPKLKLSQPLATSGGIDAETLFSAEARVPSLLRHGDRAVTRDDWRSLALQTPGVAIGRVEVMERFKPQQRRFNIPGVVSVMVIPARFGTAAPAPRADRETLERVHAWLDPRRTLGSELYVIAPDYVPMGVSAAVELIDPAQRDLILAAVKEAIRLHLWPLAPGGSDGSGWTLGRTVDDRLIETAIARIPGIRSVAPVRLFTRATSGRKWKPVPEDAGGRAQLRLRPWQLPELAMLSVSVGDSADTRLGGDGSDFDDGTGGIAVPVVPEVC
ncbi:MAG TPA: putative baseplate assembly protein [Croceibacterium sp.]